jgi:deoxyribodipyrimidine photo-lyase
MSRPVLVWFRNDLRVADHPALSAAAAAGAVVAVHIEATDPQLRVRGAASRWWLHHSLRAHAARLAGLGIRFEALSGPTAETLFGAAERHGATAIFWNRRYGPAERALDAGVKAEARARGLEARSCVGDALAEPFDMQTGSGGPYQVYTPFWKALRVRDMALPLPAPGPQGEALPAPEVDADYREPHWAAQLRPHWRIGEIGAAEALERFLAGPVGAYKDGRDIPAEPATSRLSPHLAFGELSPRQIWHRARQVAAAHPEKEAAIDKFLSEVGWREFNINQLYHRENIATVPMQPKYRDFPWRTPGPELGRWQKGLTGFPIVDAGMRELWQTGYMHNRVRMLVGSLLAKNLLIDWRLGEEWFWDTLCDADPANNPGNWQWVAGCGLDASPYFRIFNPVIQGEKFDADGHYVRKFLPELAKLPNDWLHKPFEAPDDVLRKAGVTLGETYPRPLVDLKTSRARALEMAAGL